MLRKDSQCFQHRISCNSLVNCTTIWAERVRKRSQHLDSRFASVFCKVEIGERFGWSIALHSEPGRGTLAVLKFA